MLGLILDVLILMVLIRVITGDENDGWGLPAVIAVLAAVAMFAADMAALNSPENALIILFAAVVGVGTIVALCCLLLLGIPFGKSVLIDIGFLIYKIAFIVFVSLAFSQMSFHQLEMLC